MTVYHQDFTPRMIEAVLPFSTLSLSGRHPGPKYEAFSDLVQQLNNWLKSHPTAKPFHVEVLEVDGFYGVDSKIADIDSDSRKTFRAFLKLIRLWYSRFEGRVVPSQVAYVHVLPNRLESNPRAIGPKFQNLEATINDFNEKLSRQELSIDGPLLSLQTGMFRFGADNCSLDPERTFQMVDSNPDIFHICYYFTLFYCRSNESLLHPITHHIGFRDFAPVLNWKGRRTRTLDVEKLSDVMKRVQLWLFECQVKVTNIQAIDHHAYYRCARDSPGYEANSLSNPHFQSSFLGLMQSVKVLRVFHCTCRSCYHGNEEGETLSPSASVFGQKTFHMERFVPIAQIDFSQSPLQLPNSRHVEYMSRINEWLSASGMMVMAVETSKLCLASGRSSVSSETLVFESSSKRKASAVYAVRLYVLCPPSAITTLPRFEAMMKPVPRLARLQPRKCTIL